MCGSVEEQRTTNRKEQHKQILILWSSEWQHANHYNTAIFFSTLHTIKSRGWANARTYFTLCVCLHWICPSSTSYYLINLEQQRVEQKRNWSKLLSHLQRGSNCVYQHETIQLLLCFFFFSPLVSFATFSSILSQMHKFIYTFLFLHYKKLGAQATPSLNENMLKKWNELDFYFRRFYFAIFRIESNEMNKEISLSMELLFAPIASLGIQKST